MSASGDSSSPPDLRRALLRFTLFIALLAGGFVALRWTPLADYANKEWIISTLQQLRESWWAPLAFVAIYGVLCPLAMPTTPLMAAGAIVFGLGLGSLYNFLGSILGAATSFFLARGLGHDLILHLFGDRLRRFEKTLSRHSFWAIVRIRFLPVPFPVVNFGSALMGVKPATFLFATGLGMLLPVPLWTYFWVAIFGAAAGQASHAARNVAFALLLFLTLSFAPRLWTGYRRKKRLRELNQLRKG